MSDKSFSRSFTAFSDESEAGGQRIVARAAACFAAFALSPCFTARELKLPNARRAPYADPVAPNPAPTAVKGRAMLSLWMALAVAMVTMDAVLKMIDIAPSP